MKKGLLLLLMGFGLNTTGVCQDPTISQAQTAQFSSSTNAPIVGGKSPDGKYEVRVFQTSQREPSDYFYGVVEIASGKVIKQIDDGASYCSYKAVANNPGVSQVLWNQKSDLFALMDHGGRHNEDLYLYKVNTNSVTKIETPDYLKNALSLAGFKHCYLISVAKVTGWEGNTLKCNLAFDGIPPGGGRSGVYTTDFLVEITNRQGVKPSAVLTKMKPPLEGGG